MSEHRTHPNTFIDPKMSTLGKTGGSPEFRSPSCPVSVLSGEPLTMTREQEFNIRVFVAECDDDEAPFERALLAELDATRALLASPVHRALLEVGRAAWAAQLAFEVWRDSGGKYTGPEWEAKDSADNAETTALATLRDAEAKAAEGVIDARD